MNPETIGLCLTCLTTGFAATWYLSTRLEKLRGDIAMVALTAASETAKVAADVSRHERELTAMHKLEREVSEIHSKVNQ